MSKKIFASNDKTKYAFVDDDVFEIIQDMGLKFYADKYGYFISTSHSIKLPGMKEKKQLLLHRFVWLIKTGTEPSLTVDHIDIDPANNKFSNLRLATMQQQNQHRGGQKNNKSGYIGVSHRHMNKKHKNGGNHYWRAKIMRPGRKYESKLFPYNDEGKIAASKWYDTKAKKYFGEFHGQLNFPDDDIDI